MERYRIGSPTDSNSVIIQDQFVINNIRPIYIKKISESMYSVLFFAEQYTTDDVIYLRMIIISNSLADSNYLDSYWLNYDKGNYSKELLEGANNDYLYNCDFDMSINKDNKGYFNMEAYRELENKYVAKLDIMVHKDFYIKINIFFNRLMQYSAKAHHIFDSRKLHNLEFITIDHIKHDGSATDNASNMVLSHFTCGRGPTIFSFNHAAHKIHDRKLRNPMRAELYSLYYGEDFTVSDMIYNSELDCLYILYEDRDKFTEKYKSTKILCFTNEFYNRTDLIDLNKIYEDENKED